MAPSNFFEPSSASQATPPAHGPRAGCATMVLAWFELLMGAALALLFGAQVFRGVARSPGDVAQSPMGSVAWIAQLSYVIAAVAFLMLPGWALLRGKLWPQLLAGAWGLLCILAEAYRHVH